MRTSKFGNIEDASLDATSTRIEHVAGYKRLQRRINNVARDGFISGHAVCNHTAASSFCPKKSIMMPINFAWGAC
jgi:hypothetical protein